MLKKISEKIFEAGERLLNAENNLSEELKKVLEENLPSSYIVGEGSIEIEESKIIFPGSPIFIYSIEESGRRLACIIDCYEELSVDNFHSSYDFLAKAKKLQKVEPDSKNKGMSRNEILGIILAAKSTLSLEELAKNLELLNKKIPYSQWSDAVGVLTEGTLSFSIQFPGDNRLNPFLLPANDKVAHSKPPVYVVPVISPIKKYTLNKVFSFLLTHLNAFTPGIKVPTITEIMEGAPKVNLTLAGYQFNLKGDLVPVSPKFYEGQYLPEEPEVFKSKDKKILFKMKFLPWQDGAVILLIGNVPLEGLLIYLGEKIKNNLLTIKRDSLQISYVLPIGKHDYELMLKHIQTKTPFKLQEPNKKIVKPFTSEGKSSPFIARLFIGIPKLNDSAHFNSAVNHSEFSKLYENLVIKLWSLKITSEEIIELFWGHTQKIKTQEIINIEGHTIRLKETIDQKLKKEVESFINESVRIFKYQMQNLINLFGLQIGFLYKKTSAFQTGIQSMTIKHPQLASYLCQIRNWSEQLVQVRNDIEHDGWVLPDIQYIPKDPIQIIEPKILQYSLTDFIKKIFNELICFVEEMIVYCLQQKMPEGITFIEIPSNQRNPSIPERFRNSITSSTSGWVISYVNLNFEEK